MNVWRRGRGLRVSRSVCGLAAALLATFASFAPAQPSPYHVVKGRLAAPNGRTLGSMSMVDVDAAGNVWVAERCGENNCLGHDDVAPILQLSSSGGWIKTFGAGQFAWPHAIHVTAKATFGSPMRGAAKAAVTACSSSAPPAS